ncbi:MAG: hypothetical protein IPG96_15620 [Proteobacteria bacterium]|nr:hypothetical protein [Pseudomonadota bacterium]
MQRSGSVTCWGDNSNGEATPPPLQFRSVSAGNGFSCGIKLDGRLACWSPTALPPTT